MRDFMKFLIAKIKYEARLSQSKIYVITILVVAALALGFVQYDVSEYKSTQEQKAVFQKVETNIVDIYATYRHYASYGFRVMLLPAPLSILFMNSTVLQDMTASIFPGHRLQIYQSLNGRNTYKSNKYMFADFSGILFFFGSLIALFYGYSAFYNKEYERFLSSITGDIKNYFSTILARAIMLGIFILLIIAAAVLLIDINGVPIGIDLHMFSYFIEIYFVFLFFLVLGSVFGTFRFQIVGLIGALGSWFSFLFIVPFLVSILVATHVDIIKPEFQLEMEKLKLLMNFEKRSNEKAGVHGINQKTTDMDRELVLSYSKNEFPKIQTLEEERKSQMQKMTTLYYQLSSYFPTTSYWASINEISSKGYKTLDLFYESVKKIKEAFFKEYMEKVYFSSQPEKIKVEPFLKGDENIFKGKPALPDYFLQGIFFNLLWIAAFLIPSYYRFKKILFELPDKKKNELQPHDIHIKKGTLRGWKLYGDLPGRLFFNLLSNQTDEFNKKGYTFKFTLDGQIPGTTKQSYDFIYLTPISKFPEHVKAGNFINLVMNLMNVDKAKRKEITATFALNSLKNKKLSQLDCIESGNILLAILEMKTYPIYLIDDIGKGMSLDFCIVLANKVDALWSAGSTILFLSTLPECLTRDEGGYMMAVESTKWFNQIREMKEELDSIAAKKLGKK